MSKEVFPYYNSATAMEITEQGKCILTETLLFMEKHGVDTPRIKRRTYGNTLGNTK
jgi:hypothetical protein